ncbi:acyl carrier protein [Carboxylicivirga marina]|uniref:acyl carrier protein n=1 Tax=Carboxylicivirga marina TaxID=2800988 RepID=UPI0025927B81|nr:acyl carrier protein [uncultured Carboxylicivirga sp.]
MKKEEFIEIIKEELEIDEQVNLDTRFDSLEIWDSVARLVLISLIDEQFQMQISADELKQLLTPADLINKVGLSRFEN